MTNATTGIVTDIPKPISMSRNSIMKRILYIGAGEVVLKKNWPALKSRLSGLDGLAVCSLELESPLTGLPHVYHQVEIDSHLPFSDLTKEGFLSDDTLSVIATPSDYHTHYAIQLAPFCRVAIEKPIASNVNMARLLLPFADRFYPIDHKLFNTSTLALIDRCRRSPSILDPVCRISGVFYESSGISIGRQQEDAIADLQWHLLTCMMALYKASTPTLTKVSIDKVQVSKYNPDTRGNFAIPNVCTASRIQGNFLWNGRNVTYDFRQAKGAPKSEKNIHLLSNDRDLVAEIDLNESGCGAHGRILDELMGPNPDMRHTIGDAIAVMELVDISRDMAYEEPSYVFGKLPPFLLGL